MIPLIFALLITPFTPWIDLSIETYFYNHGNDKTTHFVTSPLIDLSYTWLVWIPNTFAIIAAFFLLFRNWRKPALLVVLTMIVGSGFITHAVFKDHWGRPRPKQVDQFGGTQEFRPFWKPNLFKQTEPSKSFPCGHCSVGFLFFTVALLGERYRSRPLFWLGLALAITLGGLLSYARMAQGGHFFSDTLFSALIMWWTALMMDALVFAKEDAIASTEF